MEIILYKPPPCSNFNPKLVQKNLNGKQVRLPSFTRNRISCSRIDCRTGSRGSADNEKHPCLKIYHHGKGSRCSKVFSGNCNEYVIVNAGEDVGSMSETGESVRRVLIPGLPGETNGECGAPISSCVWEWKPKFNVHYEKSGCTNMNSPPILFLPGFGVGSFHYEKQLKDLGHDYRVWAIDFLGQGLSLPVEDPTSQSKVESTSKGKDLAWGFGDKTEPWASKLVYSMDLWRDQVRYFVEQVIGEPVYIVGNSLGGFVALYFAACHPQLKISDPESIAQILRRVYADHSTNIEKLFSCILETTQHPAAATSFASIMFAPQGELSFTEALSRCCMNNVPICLMYGKEDPWVKPIWGLQVKKQVPEAPYYEISQTGHCPHDEVPEVVNYLLRGWIKSLESQGSVSLPLLDDAQSIENNIAKDLEFMREGSKRSVRVRLLGSSFSFWNRITSHWKSKIKSQ